MKYLSASEIVGELETAKQNGKQSGEVVWWKDLVHVPLDKLVEPTGKLQILYKGKPLYVLIKGEQVVMGSSNNGTFDYNASVKLGDQDQGQGSDSYKLVEMIGEIVQSLTLAYKALGEDPKDIDPIMQHVIDSCDLKEIVQLTASEFTTKAKGYVDTKYLDLKLFPCFVTVREKEGISEETLTQDDLKTPRKVNQVFKVGSKVSCIMSMGLYISEKYVCVTANAGSQAYVDQRKCKTHFSLTQLKDMFEIDIEDDDN